MCKLQVIKSGRSAGARNRRISSLDSFSVFIVNNKHEISIINFIDLLVKDLEDGIRVQQPKLQRFKATALGLLPDVL